MSPSVSSSWNSPESLSGIETPFTFISSHNSPLLEFPWIPIRDWNRQIIYWRMETPHLEFPWIPIRDWNVRQVPSATPRLKAWNSPESLSGIETNWCAWAAYWFATWNSPESLSGIETTLIRIGEVLDVLGIPLNPYQGLKPKTISNLEIVLRLEFPWIPIRDWNWLLSSALLREWTLEFPWIPIRD